MAELTSEQAMVWMESIIAKVGLSLRIVAAISSVEVEETIPSESESLVEDLSKRLSREALEATCSASSSPDIQNLTIGTSNSRGDLHN